MNHFFQQFTLIDFFGMFVPGAFLVLMLHGDCVNFTQPIIDFFGENPIILGLYFIFISYLIGFFCHELSKILEKILLKRHSSCAAPLLNGSCTFPDELKQLIKNLILIRYGIEVGDDKEKIEKMFGVIQLRLYSRVNFSRIQLMRSFYTFCRNFMAAILVVWVAKIDLSAIKSINTFLPEVFSWGLLTGGLLYLLWHRATRFRLYAIRDIYFEFINMEIEAWTEADYCFTKSKTIDILEYTKNNLSHESPK